MLTLRLTNKNKARLINVLTLAVVFVAVLLEANFLLAKFKLSLTPSKQAQEQNALELDTKTLNELIKKIEETR